MSESLDPFRHHPDWRSKIGDPLQSRFRHMTVESIDQKMRAAGYDNDWRMTDEQRESNRQETLRGRLNDDLWVIGCGSLTWDPSFLFNEVRFATVTGFRRRFCLYSILGRGSREKPGLMVAFDPGDQAQSAAFRIARDDIDNETKIIWRREMLVGVYQPRFVSVRTAQGEIEALAFVANPKSPVYRPRVDADEAANLVANGEGFYGTCFEYVENLARQLSVFGINDPGVTSLYQNACEIRTRNG